jgi:hyperosmotically inducible periplasmic protein
MKVDYRNMVRTFLCSGLLLGVGVLAHAQEPASQAPSAADNTRTNERDRSASEPTADQQKDNRSDRDITQQIRQSIMKDKSLSTYAHNIKIITQQGQVTLKGPVQSEDEKKAIEAKAAEVAGENKVSSELNVKAQQ